MRLTKYIFRLFIVFTGFFLLISSVFLMVYSYHDFIVFILEHAGKPDKIDKFKTEYLSREKFQLLRLAFIAISLIFLFTVVKWYSYFDKKLTDFTCYTIKGILSEIHSISKRDWLIFALIFSTAALIKLYYFFAQPITNDEAFTYLNYVKSGFLAAVSYYNLTNNHILHSLLCNVFDLLPISPIYSLRITSFIAGLLLSFFAFLFFNKFLNRKAKFIAFVFFSFSLPVLQYGFLARGYSLLLFFTILSSFVLLKLSQTIKNRKNLWVLYVLSSVFGFYSVPVYVYVYASQVVFYFLIVGINYKKRYLRQFFIVSFITALIVSILYLPVLFINGIGAFSSYNFMKALQFPVFIKEYFQFLPDYFIWITGNNFYFALFSFIVVLVGFVYSFKSKKVLFLFILSFLFVPLLISLFQRIMPFKRLFIFNSLIIALSYGLFTEFLLKTIKREKQKANFLLTGVSVFMALILFFSFNNHCKQQEQINNKAYYYAGLIDDNTSIYSTNEVRYYTFLKFKAMYLDKKHIELFRSGFDKNYPYNYISEDKDKNEKFSSLSKYKYTLLYEDEYVRLYKISNEHL
ncbi:MAG: hypothetical protein L3J74_00970 [Bacteroidales bacterium]|nr:hypothetical protein [Bacteroidales bacterium]